MGRRRAQGAAFRRPPAYGPEPVRGPDLPRELGAGHLDGPFGVGIVASSYFSISSLERQANRAFRRREYARAAELFGQLAEQKPLARNNAFLGAALGASERYEESIEASTKAIEEDPEYGIAYYNRALVRQRTGKTNLAVKDLNKALEVDLPRRFRTAVRKMLEKLS